MSDLPAVLSGRDPATGDVDSPGSCRHCGLALSRSQRATGETFCCEGCRRVHRLIREAGLGRYYDLRGTSTAPPEKPREDFDWLDRRLDPGEPDGAPRRIAFDVQGIHCAACLWLLQELFRRLPGGVDLRINPALGRADVVWDSSAGDLKEFLREASRFGYRFGPEGPRVRSSTRGLVVRLGVCAAAAMNSMIFSLSFYFGLAPTDGVLFPFFGWLNFALGTVAFLVGGTLFIARAWQGLRRRIVHLDLPIAVGVLLAYAGSVHGQVTVGPEAAYFDSLTVFITLMVLGRWLQERLLERNRMLLLEDAGESALFTRRFHDGHLDVIPATEARSGDEIWVNPGEIVPVAGTLIGSSAAISLEWITGEAAPRAVDVGHAVPAGAYNESDCVMRLTASEDFESSRVHELLRSHHADGSFGKWWQRVGSIYVLAVGVLAAAGFLLWLPAGASRALEVTISILVVTCPCALGLATPLAVDLATGALRKRGVFIRDARFFERALSVRKVIFDKTGTLTLGRMRLDEPSAGALRRLEREELVALTNLVARSSHPVSNLLRQEIDALERVEVLPSFPVREVVGRGVVGTEADRIWRIGRADFALGRPDVSSETVFTVDGVERARFRFIEELRDDAVDETRSLAAEGYETHLLSGDESPRVGRVAAALGIPPERVGSGLTPEEKAERVRALDREDTLMVGDGLNDRPSFEAGHCAATPAVDHAALPSAADFFFLGSGISAVRAALAGAKRLRRVVRDNLVLAVAYNVVALGFCFAGLVTPVVAAVLMPLSSVGIVTLTAARLRERTVSWK